MSRGFIPIMAVASVLLAAMPVSAAGVGVGTVRTATGDVFIARNGRMIPVKGHAPLFAGDRVVTRSAGAARIAMNDGCVADLAAMSMTSVGTAGCGTVTSLHQVRVGSRPGPEAENFVAGAGPALFIQLALNAIADGALAADRPGPYPKSP